MPNGIFNILRNALSAVHFQRLKASKWALESALPLPNVQRRFNAAANRSAFSGEGGEWSAKASYLWPKSTQPPLHTPKERHTTLNWQDLALKNDREEERKEPGGAQRNSPPWLQNPTFPGRDSEGMPTGRAHNPLWDRAKQ
jgi:hypothetical protein